MARAKVTHRPKLEVVANPKVSFGLTPKQEKFCKIYATQEVTQTEAAIEAGYAKSNAHAIASKMLNGRDFPQILDRIHQLKIELQQKYEVTFESHVRKLSQIRDDLQLYNLNCYLSKNVTIRSPVKKDFNIETVFI